MHLGNNLQRQFNLVNLWASCGQLTLNVGMCEMDTIPSDLKSSKDIVAQAKVARC